MDPREKEKILVEYNKGIIWTRNISPILLVIDTYDMLKKIEYNENEALKLTDIICKSYYQFKKIEHLEDEMEE